MRRLPKSGSMVYVDIDVPYVLSWDEQVDPPFSKLELAQASPLPWGHQGRSDTARLGIFTIRLEEYDGPNSIPGPDSGYTVYCYLDYMLLSGQPIPNSQPIFFASFNRIDNLATAQQLAAAIVRRMYGV